MVALSWLRVVVVDADLAATLAEMLSEKGFQATAQPEWLAGEDDGEDAQYVIRTDAPLAQVEHLLPTVVDSGSADEDWNADENVWIEVETSDASHSAERPEQTAEAPSDRAADSPWVVELPAGPRRFHRPSSPAPHREASSD